MLSKKPAEEKRKNAKTKQKNSTKILIRNVPFEAKASEVRQLFGYQYLSHDLSVLFLSHDLSVLFLSHDLSVQFYHMICQYCFIARYLALEESFY